ncbi:SusC/RagA family TonB-linked outer membrane protein [Dyadobacter chenwenxiniae]|uniref:SusC/RagA family TonB-linked outer membrane protein n=1 Tax=Dyadobacter chenwenxiniae TaxID=2906456 RepID=A0A9X1PH39_9BACT|nr:SusC/RagA family TonB-linked outer membrane protein [Dyadobacter chenwenxiniae]MCF0061112.1 SusC/RagA family TonB-linked outer membrane protein [Dyadobacter chenwenxiniae]UON80939.1 SusC/RagA family TonB-linked outer membrane protein [Dyadobacter chenwenxiniae]
MNVLYRISGLSRLSFLLVTLLFFSNSISAFSATISLADIEVKGVVKSATGEKLIGSTIRVKGTQKGTVTNENGEFLLQGVPDGATLVVTMIGFLPKEVKAAKSISVELAEDAVGLQDVVVTGFQQIDKNKFTGSAVTLKTDDVKIDGLPDVSRMLEGRAAGVSVQNVSGTFGAAPKVRIRGATSLNGDNKPLWVIDGVVQEDIVNISNDQLSSGDPTTLLGSAVAGLNPNDIETFDILKDAAAAALYGARAMNGVIVITTKKGKSGKPVITYSGNFSTQLTPSYRNFNIMNSAQQMSVLGELERKGYLTSSVLSKADYGVYGKYYNSLTGDDQGNFPIANTPEAKRDFLLRYAKVNTDWFDVLFKQNFIQEHSVSVSFGTDKSQSYVSTSYLDDNGWTIADKVKRYTLNFKNNYQLSDKVSLGLLTLASVRRQDAPGSLSRRSNPVEGKFDRDFDINPFSYALNTSRTLTAYDENGDLEFFRRNFAPFNIVSELANNRIKLNLADIKLQGNLSYKITDHITYDFLGALRYIQTGREHIITENSNMANAYRAADNSTIALANKYLYTDPDVPNAYPVVVLPSGGFYNRNEDQMLFYNVRNNLRFNQTFRERHAVDLLVGQEIKYTNRQNSNNTGYGFQYEQGGTPFVDYRILKQTIEANFPYYGMRMDYERFAAFYGSAGYTLDDKYNFTGYIRYDGSNGFGKSAIARWLPTYTVAGSWNFDREEFIKRFKWLSMGRLRASYGLSADTGPATNSAALFQSIITKRPYLDEKESAIQLTSLENTELTWEKLYSGNVGLDLGFFANRINLSVDGYIRNSFDLIDEIKTSGIGGQIFKVANYADMQSYGVDFSLDGVLFKNKDWDFRSRITVGYARTNITNVDNNPGIFDLVKAEGANVQGRPVRSLFSIKYNSLDPKTGVPIFLNETGEVSSDVYLQDQNISYLQYEGSVDPPITGGFNNTLTYKDLSLNVFLTYQAGNKIRLNPLYKSTFSDLDAMPREFLDRWVTAADQGSTNVPAISDQLQLQYLTGTYPYNIYNYSTERVAKGDFVRLKSVSLAYKVPLVIASKYGFKGASIQVSSINPWLIYADKKLKGQDPEFFNSGGVAQPIQKQFTVALKLTL